MVIGTDFTGSCKSNYHATTISPMCSHFKVPLNRLSLYSELGSDNCLILSEPIFRTIMGRTSYTLTSWCLRCTRPACLVASSLKQQTIGRHVAPLGHHIILTPKMNQCLLWLLNVVSSTNKTDRHDITVILLKVALNTIKHTSKYQFYNIWLGPTVDWTQDNTAPQVNTLSIFTPLRRFTVYVNLLNL